MRTLLMAFWVVLLAAVFGGASFSGHNTLVGQDNEDQQAGGDEERDFAARTVITSYRFL